MSPCGKTRRAAEFAVLYLGVPILLRLAPEIARRTRRPVVIPIIPVLVLVAAIVLLFMLRSKMLEPVDLVTFSGVTRRDWAEMLGRFVAAAALLSVALYFYKPEALLRFPRERIGLWAMVMLLYPIVSVLAQGVVYRAFYALRYAPAFPASLQVLFGACVFSFAHLAFANAFALAFTFVGGLFFLTTYRRTGSLLFSNLEHALYGDFLFTIGWGEYFFHAGTLRMLSQS
ncbi:MAG: type II CAAX prenyl endopeptidase Rce1 family protein [Kiritimatiellia bacterium]|jgi:hypothetical protein